MKIWYFAKAVLIRIWINFLRKDINQCSANSRHESRFPIMLNNTIFIANSMTFAVLLIPFCRNYYSHGKAFQTYLQLKSKHTVSLTVFPAPFGPTKIVNGLKKVIICLSLSSTPKLLTPRILIFSILDISAEQLLLQSQSCKHCKSCKTELCEKSSRQKSQ